jgi:hypothetical protein
MGSRAWRQDKGCITEPQRSQNGPLDTKLGLIMHAQADSAMCSGCSGRAQ